MLRENIRNAENKIIGENLVVERGTYINKLGESRDNLSTIDSILKYKYEKLLKLLTRKNKNKILQEVSILQNNKRKLEKQIDELLNARVYDHFKEHNFNAEHTGKIKLIDIMTPEQKERQEELNKQYNLIRMNRTGVPLINLEENNYKK